MEIVKEIESVLTDAKGNTQPTISFDGGYQIWFRNIYDTAPEKSGLASDFTDVNGVYESFRDALRVATDFSEDIYDEYEVIIQQYFSIFDEECQGYKSVDIDLLSIDYSNGTQRLKAEDDILNIFDEIYNEEDE